MAFNAVNTGVVLMVELHAWSYKASSKSITISRTAETPRLRLAVVKVAQLHQRPVSGLYVQKRYLQISSNVVKRSADVAGYLCQHVVTSGVCNCKTAQLQAFKNQGQFGWVADGQQSRAQQ